LPTHVRHRIISWRLHPAVHPFADDGAGSLWALMNASLKACPGYTFAERWMMRLWAAGVLFLPDAAAHRLMSTTPKAPVWGRLLRWSRRMAAEPGGQ
jgi:hypothetical protein